MPFVGNIDGGNLIAAGVEIIQFGIVSQIQLRQATAGNIEQLRFRIGPQIQLPDGIVPDAEGFQAGKKKRESE